MGKWRGSTSLSPYYLSVLVLTELTHCQTLQHLLEAKPVEHCSACRSCFLKSNVSLALGMITISVLCMLCTEWIFKIYCCTWIYFSLMHCHVRCLGFAVNCNTHLFDCCVQSQRRRRRRRRRNRKPQPLWLPPPPPPLTLLTMSTKPICRTMPQSSSLLLILKRALFHTHRYVRDQKLLTCLLLCFDHLLGAGPWWRQENDGRRLDITNKFVNFSPSSSSLMGWFSVYCFSVGGLLCPFLSPQGSISCYGSKAF